MIDSTAQEMSYKVLILKKKKTKTNSVFKIKLIELTAPLFPVSEGLTLGKI